MASDWNTQYNDLITQASAARQKGDMGSYHSLIGRASYLADTHTINQNPLSNTFHAMNNWLIKVGGGGMAPNTHINAQGLPEQNAPASPAATAEPPALQPKPGQGADGQKAPVNPYEEAANQLAQQYLGMVSNLGKMTDQQAVDAASSRSNADALALIGQGAQSPAAQYLDAASKQASAESQASGMTAAEQALQTASAQGAQLEAQGIQGLGKAEATMSGMAQYQQILNALSNEAYYNIYKGTTLPNLSGAPVGVQEAVSGVSGQGGMGVGNGAVGLPSFTTAAGTSATGTNVNTPSTSGLLGQ
jgi:hypothetical protein